MADLESRDIIVSILKGDQDEALPDIGKACESRLDAGHVRVRWWVHFDDRYITAESMNILAARYFQTVSGVVWEHADPGSMVQRVFLVQAQLIEGDGMDYLAAVEKLRTFKEADITYGEYAQVNPPKDVPSEG